MIVRPALVAVFTLGAFLLTGCTETTRDPVGTDVDTVASGDPTPAASASPSAPSGTSASSSPPAAAVRVIEATYAAGEVTGVTSRVAAVLGEKLLVRVTSDVADEVHIHGYDLTADVPAGGTVELPLTVSIAGGFEVELEQLGKPLFQLRVT